MNDFQSFQSLPKISATHVFQIDNHSPNSNLQVTGFSNFHKIYHSILSVILLVMNSNYHLHIPSRFLDTISIEIFCHPCLECTTEKDIEQFSFS